MQKMHLRSPVCSVMGHVDHGKTLLLDKIRGTAINASEAGKITQAIGASIIPLDVIKNICGHLLDIMKKELTIPGLLFIDTPGHAAFTNLRKRGGNLADIAIVVIDINEGIMPQTVEAIEILKGYKTPFIIAANKIDLISGWQSGQNVLETIGKQDKRIIQELETKLYNIVGKLSQLGLNSERFDRVDDYTKQIAIVPTSAKTGEGIPELLMVLTGLAQKYLEECLHCDVCGFAKGTILEVKEEKGLGITLDTIIYNGCLNVNDTVVIGGVDSPITAKIKALFEPMPLAEMRDKKAKFQSVKKVVAATGVKISAPGTEQAVAGMPIRATDDEHLEQTKKEIQKEVEEVLIETDKTGIIIKAESLGSLEAMIKLLKEKKIKIRKADIGNITKKDISEAESNYEKDPFTAVVLGFNVIDDSKVKSENVRILINNVIYNLLEDFERWLKEEKEKQEAKQLEKLTRPCKIQIMPGYVFRQSNPAIVGCDVLAGKSKTGIDLMKEGRTITTIKTIQADKESLTELESGKQASFGLTNITIGRQANEGDILYSAISEDDFRRLKKLKHYLKKDEIEVIKEIAEIMRKNNPVWGV